MKAVIRESRATLVLAIPITIGQVSQMLMGITDSVMIGRTGAIPLAASSFGLGVFNIFFIVGVGLLTPVAVFASGFRSFPCWPTSPSASSRSRWAGPGCRCWSCSAAWC